MAELSNGYQSLVTEYAAYIGQNMDKVYGGASPADIMHNLNTELPLVTFEASLIGLTLDLSERSREAVKEAANWERYYQEAIRTYKGQ